MNGIPADFDPSFFVSREVEQITMAINQVAIWFGEDAGIIAENGFEFTREDGSKTNIGTNPPVDIPLGILLGRRVTSASVAEGKTLRLIFEGGAQLSYADDSAEFECFHVLAGGREIHV